MKRICILPALFMAFIASSCSSKKIDSAASVYEAMDTVMRIDVFGENADLALNLAKTSILNLEKSLSTTDPEAKVYLINKLSSEAESEAEFVKIGDLNQQEKDLISFSLKMADKTNGAFNPCLYSVTKAWGFTTGNYTVPSNEEIALQLSKTDYTKVQLSENKIILPKGMMLDFGAVGKGYAGDVAIETLKKNGIQSALLFLGGNCQCVGKKTTGEKWGIGIRNPVGAESDVIAGVYVEDCAVITSGGYNRNFTADDGNEYIHIIDPKTGRPVNNGLVSVTIVTKSGGYGDVLSTALFVMGEKDSIEFWKNNKDELFDFIMIKQNPDSSLSLLYTEGLKDSITLMEDQVSEIQMIAR